MAELAVADGMPPPADLPRGEFICTRLPDGGIHIDHADPCVLVSAELLHAIADGDGSHGWLDLRVSGMFCLVGAVLHIDGVNRQVIYRIVDYVPSVHGYIAEWPD